LYLLFVEDIVKILGNWLAEDIANVFQEVFGSEPASWTFNFTLNPLVDMEDKSLGRRCGKCFSEVAVSGELIAIEGGKIALINLIECPQDHIFILTGHRLWESLLYFS
jgi:hypothetical protein